MATTDPNEFAKAIKTRFKRVAPPPSGGDDTAVLTSAFQNGWILQPGIYNYNGTSGIDATGGNLAANGSAHGLTTINIVNSTFLLDSTQKLWSAHLSNMKISGGLGFFRQGYTGADMTTPLIFENLWVDSYTKAAITSENADMPHVKIRNCRFWGAANNTTAMGVALAGGTDQTIIEGCWFTRNRVDIKIGAVGQNSKIRHNDFAGYDDGSSTTATHVWLVPSSQQGNSGGGLIIEANKFGNENQHAGDLPILYADEGGGTTCADRMPSLAASTGYATSQIIRGNNFMGALPTAPNPVTTWAPNMHGLTVVDNIISGSRPAYGIYYAGTVPLADTNTRSGEWIIDDSTFILPASNSPFVRDSRYSRPRAFTSQSGNYTITAADELVQVQSPSAATVTLPDAATVPGRIFTIVNTGSAAITIGGVSNQKISGGPSGWLGTSASLAAGATMRLCAEGWWLVL